MNTTRYPSRVRGFHFFINKPWMQLAQDGELSAGSVWWWRRALDACHIYNVTAEHRKTLRYAVRRIGVDRLLESEAWTPAGGDRVWLKGLLLSLPPTI